MEKKKVEFIESYIKIGNGDYQWNDNHGELIRCKDCKYHAPDMVCNHPVEWGNENSRNHCDPDFFCSDGERLEI